MSIKSATTVGMAFLSAALGTMGAPMNALAQTATAPVAQSPSNPALSIPQIDTGKIMAQCVPMKEERRGFFNRYTVQIPVVNKDCFVAHDIVLVYQEAFNPLYNTDLQFEIAGSFKEMLDKLTSTRRDAYADSLPNSRHENGTRVTRDQRREASETLKTLDEQLKIIDDGIKGSGKFSDTSSFLNWYNENKPQTISITGQDTGNCLQVWRINGTQRINFSCTPIP